MAVGVITLIAGIAAAAGRRAPPRPGRTPGPRNGCATAAP